MIDNSVFLKISDVELLALLVYGEARGEIDLGKNAIARVVVNRLNQWAWYGKSVKEVCLKKYQFSCFNENDPNRAKLLELAEMEQKPTLYNLCLNAAIMALNENSKDITNGATHYFNPKIVTPAWAKNMKKTCTIGNHEFYK